MPVTGAFEPINRFMLFQLVCNRYACNGRVSERFAVSQISMTIIIGDSIKNTQDPLRFDRNYTGVSLNISEMKLDFGLKAQNRCQGEEPHRVARF